MRNPAPLYTQSELESKEYTAYACGCISGIALVTGLILIGLVVL